MKDWSHKKRAFMSHSPFSYFSGVPREGVRIGDLEEFEIEDPRKVEMAILKNINSIPPNQLDAALEATGWLILDLVQDEFPEARLRSAAILYTYANFWIRRSKVRLVNRTYEGDLAQAVQEYIEGIEAIDDPDQVARVKAAFDKIDRAPIDDPLIAARLIVGIGRRYRSGPLKATGEMIIRRTAVRSILAALKAGQGDSDADVAEASRVAFERLNAIAQPE